MLPLYGGKFHQNRVRIATVGEVSQWPYNLCHAMASMLAVGRIIRSFAQHYSAVWELVMGKFVISLRSVGSRDTMSQTVCRISGCRKRQNRKCTYGAQFITVDFDTGNGTEHAQWGVKRSQPLPVRRSNGHRTSDQLAYDTYFELFSCLFFHFYWDLISYLKCMNTLD